MPSKPLLIIQPATSHDDLPALCAKREDEATWFREATGYAADNVITAKVHLGDPLPAQEEVQAVIITGAIDMVTDGHAWIEETAEWLRSAIDAGVPLLGVCFGHHLLAYAVGGEVGNNSNGPMFGNVPVTLTEGAQDDDLFAGLPRTTEMQVFHYQSILSLPPNATILAAGPHDPYYAVRFADKTWGVQFHPEFDAEIMDYTYDVYAPMMQGDGFAVADLRANNRDCPDGKRLLARFAEIALQEATGLKRVGR